MATVSSKAKPARGRRHVFVGVVVSDKADKTRVVSVARTTKHRRYEKVLHGRSKFYVHDAENKSRKGDTVEIMGTRPISKLKRWRLVRVLKKAVQATVELENDVVLPEKKPPVKKPAPKAETPETPEAAPDAAGGGEA
ncbi:30S ribosomal protein S17 [Elusimicrobiota bacterium]